MSRTPIKHSPSAGKLHLSTRGATTPQSTRQQSLNNSRSLQSPLTCTSAYAPEVTGTRPPSRPSSQKTTALPSTQHQPHLASHQLLPPHSQQESEAAHPPTRPLPELSERKGLISRADIPPPLAQTLEHIVGQVAAANLLSYNSLTIEPI